MLKPTIRPITDEERKSWPAEVLIRLEKPFVDVRGVIQPLLDVPMQSAVLIQSGKGSLRANHYHLTDWHYCYVLSGRMEYFHRPHGQTDKPEMIAVGEGNMIFTPPMVDHAMVFPADTVFLTLSRNARDQATYEADVRRIDMVSTDALKTWKPGD